jgi:predicted dehydrogenase
MTEAPPLRAALIGCGRIALAATGREHGLGARTHAEAYADCPRTVLVAGCDPDADARARLTAVTGAAAFDSVERMLADTRPDIVSISSPDATHVDALEMALAAGVRGVLIEKPLALSSAEAARALDIAAASPATVAMNFSRRYSPGFRAIAAWVRDGGLGPLQAVRGSYTNGVSRNGSHLIDLARWFGGDVRQVRASCRAGLEGADPSLDVTLAFEGPLAAQLTALDGRAFDHFELDVIGTTGRVRFVRFGHDAEIYGVENSERHPGYREEVLRERREGLLTGVLGLAVAALVESVEAGVPPLSTLADGAAVVGLVEAARRAAASGVPVAVA